MERLSPIRKSQVGGRRGKGGGEESVERPLDRTRVGVGSGRGTAFFLRIGK